MNRVFIFRRISDGKTTELSDPYELTGIDPEIKKAHIKNLISGRSATSKGWELVKDSEETSSIAEETSSIAEDSEKALSETPKNIYQPSQPIQEVISTGCTLADLALGGGIAEGKISQVYSSTGVGKSLFAIELCANFKMKYPGGEVGYLDSEAAFQPDYATSLGIKIDEIDFAENSSIEDANQTVEGMYEFLELFVDRCKSKKSSGFLVVDSLDALSDRAELGREIDKATFAMNKQKTLSGIFRRLASKLDEANITILIVSQTRANIGVMFGPKTSPGGGSAIGFYCSQRILLKQKGKIKKTISGESRQIGTEVELEVTKNRIAPPFRKAEFSLLFGYGTDNLSSNLRYLLAHDKVPESICKTSASGVTRFLNSVGNLPEDEYRRICDQIKDITVEVYEKINESFAPSRPRKY